MILKLRDSLNKPMQTEEVTIKVIVAVLIILSLWTLQGNHLKIVIRTDEF